MVFEQYRLVLHHEMLINGERDPIDKPLVLVYSVDRFAPDFPGRAIVLNDMLERFKMEVLTRESAE